MNKLDLDISKYSVSELQDVFNVSQNMNSEEIVSHINNFRSNTFVDSNLTLVDKDNIASFLDRAVSKLCSPLDKMHLPTLS